MHSTNINKNAPLLTHTMRTTLEHLASVSSKQDLSWCKLVPHSFPTITNTHALCCYCFLVKNSYIPLGCYRTVV